MHYSNEEDGDWRIALSVLLVFCHANCYCTGEDLTSRLSVATVSLWNDKEGVALPILFM